MRLILPTYSCTKFNFIFPDAAVVLAFSAAFQSGDHQTILDALLNPDFNLQNVRESNIDYYVKALQDEVEEKAKGSDVEEISFSAQNIQKCVDTGNEEAKRLLLAGTRNSYSTHHIKKV